MTTSEPASRSDAELAEALAGARTMLESDGFEAGWDVDPAGGVHFTVRPGSAECQDCLVPKPVMAAIIGDALSGTPWSLAEITLPGDAAE
ncbi:hypothetical protein [Blastococcus tunisiensis]|uniref:NifU-like domain-containing protein n=1 Tax=Blastococcus tunisiensis TaxID=1798228 RepID=A0A1I1WMJ9_9ACTN|nr:hypothetical protein [Blastococcus sp. DSM 46838]SFD96444.1 hypothetical protein SAMN05216574_101456 [Blastococcus sp. DSM 46838]